MSLPQVDRDLCRILLLIVLWPNRDLGHSHDLGHDRHLCCVLLLVMLQTSRDPGHNHDPHIWLHQKASLASRVSRLSCDHTSGYINSPWVKEILLQRMNELYIFREF